MGELDREERQTRFLGAMRGLHALVAAQPTNGGGVEVSELSSLIWLLNDEAQGCIGRKSAPRAHNDYG